MFEVTILETGDSAEADTAEDAVFAGLTLAREAKAARGIHGFDPTIRFDRDGEMVRTATLRSLTR